ncbi:uncharacterized protein LOC106557569 isoform X5 [Canis lupus familiaris]|uniref:uncharacterized protein LOC106557569 isoform X5 n=1 Tax=Canis lupus familiaris TaxID=9615 RepID=UPI0018F66E21|nr:uncharacterized protein LOC106557569 isoform X5 [Canis lupus familiaris]
MACHSPGLSGISSPLTPVGEEGIPNGTLSTSDANRPLVQRKPAFCWSEERFRRGSKNRAGSGRQRMMLNILGSSTVLKRRSFGFCLCIEREHMRGRLREKKRQSLQPTALLNSEPDVVLDPMILRSQPTLKPRVGHLVD